MTEEQENQYWRAINVLVQRQSISDKSRCQVKRCKRHDKYAVFVGNTPALSTMDGNYCPLHLEKGISKAIDFRNSEVKRLIAAAKHREKQDAKRLLGIKKQIK